MKYLFLLIITFATLTVKGQTTAKAQPIKKDSAKYQKVIIVPLSDYNLIYGALQDYKRLAIYDPNNTDSQKITAVKNIEAYLKDLNNRVRVDSVKVNK